jgi:hypothetical protein
VVACLHGQRIHYLAVENKVSSDEGIDWSTAENEEYLEEFEFGIHADGGSRHRTPTHNRKFHFSPNSHSLSSSRPLTAPKILSHSSGRRYAPSTNKNSTKKSNVHVLNATHVNNSSSILSTILNTPLPPPLLNGRQLSSSSVIHSSTSSGSISYQATPVQSRPSTSSQKSNIISRPSTSASSKPQSQSSSSISITSTNSRSSTSSNSPPIAPTPTARPSTSSSSLPISSTSSQIPPPSPTDQTRPISHFPQYSSPNATEPTLASSHSYSSLDDFHRDQRVSHTQAPLQRISSSDSLPMQVSSSTSPSINSTQQHSPNPKEEYENETFEP